MFNGLQSWYQIGHACPRRETHEIGAPLSR